MSLWQLRDVRFLESVDPPEVFDYWRSKEHRLANGRFVAWNHQFALAEGLVVDFNRCHGRAGGEPIEDVFNQPESEEYYTFERGFLSLPDPFAYRMPFYLQQWMASFSTQVPEKIDHEHEGVYVGLTRYEYANLYHVLTDLFNCFVVLTFLGIDPKSTTLVLMDGHPESIMDGYYGAFFGECRRLGEFDGVHRFESFVFGMANRQTTLYPSLMGKDTQLAPFRDHLLRVLGVEPRRTVKVERVTLVWRKPYLAHPRRPDGYVERKIANEAELLGAVRARFPDMEVRDVVLETLSLKEQVALMAESDIVVGMHGAALSYEFVMPENSGVLELFPVYHPPWEHYRILAQLRGLHYRRWVNADQDLELPGEETVVPPSIVIDGIEALVADIETTANALDISGNSSEQS